MQAVQGAQTSSTAPAQSAAAVYPPLPEAPASANCHVMIAGRQVQVTLRDTDETRLLAAHGLAGAVSGGRPTTGFPPVSRVSTGQPEGWCAVHSVQMRRNEKDGRSWYSHRHRRVGGAKGNRKARGVKPLRRPM